ncbi:MAG: hypothetical protein P8X85_22140 [Desulfobacterales bacterium]
MPDLFADTSLDPVESATGYQKTPLPSQRAVNPAVKKKAGFYISVDLLQRFTLKYHELKLAGVAVDNKSTLLELALSFALDDMDKGNNSQVLKKLG